MSQKKIQSTGSLVSVEVTDYGSVIVKGMSPEEEMSALDAAVFSDMLATASKEADTA